MSTVVSEIALAAKQTPTLLHESVTAPPVSAKAPNDVHSLRRLLTVGEVAGILRVHPNRVYELASRRALPAVRVGRLLRFHADTFQEWIRSGGTQDPTAECANGFPWRRG